MQVIQQDGESTVQSKKKDSRTTEVTGLVLGDLFWFPEGGKCLLESGVLPT